MITSYKNSVSKYSALFNKATIELTKHNAEGAEVAQGEGSVLGFSPVEGLTETDFYAGIYYFKDDNGEYVEANEIFDADAEYYQISDSISTLQEYFCYIEELAAISPEVFTRLPLDEELFDVDLNARTIKVPSDFNKNGVAVTGDKRAEYLWFKVPRYFDMNDLSEKLCRVEWKTAAKENNMGVSEIWGSYDLGTENEYMIFGWCIEDVLTADAGKITFSLRFYSVEDEAVTYSLSTLPATINVKAGIGFTINDITSGEYIYDDQAKDTNRFTNSHITDAAQTKPEPAKFILIDEVGLVEAMNLTEGIKGSTSMKEIVPVAAVSIDGGTISYRWIRKEVDGKGVATVIPSYAHYEKTKDTSRKDNKVYYTKNVGDGGREVYAVYLGDSITEEIFEKQSVAEIKEPGMYTVTAINRIGGATNQDCVSANCIVAPASKPAFGEDFAKQANVTVAKDGVVSLNAYDEKQHMFSELVEDCVHTYQWLKDGVEIEGATKKVLEIAVTENNMADIQGIYSVVVTNTINNSKAAIASADCRVTFKPNVPNVVNMRNIDGSIVENVPVNSTVEIDCNIAGNDLEEAVRTEEDSFAYQWMSFAPNTANSKKMDEIIKSSYKVDDPSFVFDYKTVLDGKGNLVEIKDATEKIYTRTTPGFVFCVVTNKLNGDTAENASAIVQFYSDPADIAVSNA